MRLDVLFDYLRDFVQFVPVYFLDLFHSEKSLTFIFGDDVNVQVHYVLPGSLAVALDNG